MCWSSSSYSFPRTVFVAPEPTTKQWSRCVNTIVCRKKECLSWNKKEEHIFTTNVSSHFRTQTGWAMCYSAVKPNLWHFLCKTNKVISWPAYALYKYNNYAKQKLTYFESHFNHYFKNVIKTMCVCGCVWVCVCDIPH